MELPVLQDNPFIKALIDNALISFTDKNGKIIYANENYCSLCGYQQNELLNQKHSILNSGLHNSSFFSMLWETIIDGKTWKGEIRNKAKNGNYFWVDITITPLLDKDNKPEYFLATYNETTNQKQLIDTLKQRAHRQGLVAILGQLSLNSKSIQGLIEQTIAAVAGSMNMSMGLITELGENHNELKVRAIAGLNYQIAQNDVISNTAEMVSFIKDQDNAVTIEELATENRFELPQQLTIDGLKSAICVLIGDLKHPFGILLLFSESTITPNLDDIYFLQSISNIISEAFTRDKVELLLEKEKQLERELYQAQKMEALGILASGIAHDFNNILSSILGYADLAIEKFAPEKEGKLFNYLKEIESAGSRAKDIIIQMQNFNAPEKNIQSPVLLTSLLKDTLKMLRSAIPSSVTFEQHYAEDIPPVLINPSKLNLILMNLLSNANDSMNGKGTINLSIDCTTINNRPCSSCGQTVSGNYVELVISDTGEGISNDQISRIFEPEYTTKANRSGSGLTIINRATHDSGGHILVESIEGKGTTFRLLFKPSSTSELETANAAPVTPQATSNAHIMIVDDENSLTIYLSEVFEDHGYKVTIFTDPTEAKAFFTSNPDLCDLILTDQTMPGLTGAELAESIYAIRPEVPVILCTGYSDLKDRETLSKTNIRGFLSKPFETDTLLKLVYDTLK